MQCFEVRAERGFSLVELMVGVTIGVVALLVVSTMLSSSESQKRTTMGVDDAQNAGVLALDRFQNEIWRAGFGFSEVRVLGCQLDLDLDTSTPSGRPVPLVPVVINPATTIIPAGDANSDTLLVTYANPSGASAGMEVFHPNILGSQTAGTLQLTITRTPSDAQRYYLWASPTLAVGDWFFVDPGTAPATLPTVACTRTLEIQRVAVREGVDHAVAPAPTAGTGLLYNLGPTRNGATLPSLQVQAFAVRNGSLTVCDYIAANCGAACTAGDGTCSADWRPIAANVAVLRAEYVVDANTGTGDLDGVAEAFSRTAPTTGCGWAKVSAVRLALVMQSPQSDGQLVTAAVPPTWAGSPNAGSEINLDAVRVGDGMTWRNYRYKVFETTVPLRNNPAWMMVRMRDHSRPDYREPTGCIP